MSKILITKSDGTPTKSKVFAKQFLQEKGIDENCLIEENGQFFYENAAAGALTESKAQSDEGVNEDVQPSPESVNLTETASISSIGEGNFSSVTWETPVFYENNKRTKLIVPGSDVEAVIIAKHPAGQLRNNSCFELAIGQENFIMSLELISKIFKLKEIE